MVNTEIGAVKTSETFDHAGGSLTLRRPCMRKTSHRACGGSRSQYEVKRHMPIRVGGWHCVERHMKLNSVTAAGEANADGIEELWVDGQLTIRNAAVRFRRTPKLRITCFTLETYYHGLPKDFDASHPIKVFYDNVVIARAYIGPIGGKAPASAAAFGRGSKEATILSTGAR